MNGERQEAPPGLRADRLGELYAHRFSADERQRKTAVWRVLCEEYLQRYVRPDAVVLDLGAGYCDFVNHIRAARRIAVDLNPETPRYAAPGVEVRSLALAEIGAAVEPESIDVAFASNVFEHLRSPDALLEVLAAVRVALKPGGRLIVLQPNVRLVGGRFWDFFDHTLPLTEKGLAEALAVARLRVVECRARFLPYTTKGSLPVSPALLRLYLALKPAQWLLGKQMLVVATRDT